MKLSIEAYRTQVQRWPRSGQHILAQFDANSIVIYQAYRPAIGEYAVRHQMFGGEWSFSRMSWIKTNFLWMMYRSGWGTKSDQELTLAVRIQRAGFDQLLRDAVHANFVADRYTTQAAWSNAVAQSSVRLQWDPDHDPSGAKVERRAIQLGLRGKALAWYARDWILDIEDISLFVAEQRQYAQSKATYAYLQTPCEDVYSVLDTTTAQRLGLSSGLIR